MPFPRSSLVPGSHSPRTSIWKTVRALKLRPGTLRVRVADYRLLFEIGSGEALHLTDFILRRDLDRWLAAGGR